MSDLVSPAPRPRHLLGALLALAMIGALLAGCTGHAVTPDAVDRLTTALRGSDPPPADVEVDTGTDGAARVLTIVVAVDEPSIDAERLRGILVTTVDTIGDDGADQIALGVRQGDLTGELLPVWPAMSELGFRQRASRGDDEFVESLATVRRVLGR